MAALEGWLYKSGARLGAISERKRYFVLDSEQKLLRFYQSDAKKEPRGVIDMSAATSVEVTGDTSFELSTQSRLYDLRAETAALAGQWVDTLTRLIAAAESVTSAEAATPESASKTESTIGDLSVVTPTLAPDEVELHAAPWCVEAVWLDKSKEDAPLHISAELPDPSLWPKGTPAVARIKLSDGTVYSANLESLADGESHEIASAGDSTLRAQLGPSPSTVPPPLKTAAATAATPASVAPTPAAAVELASVPELVWTAAVLVVGLACGVALQPFVARLTSNSLSASGLHDGIVHARRFGPKGPGGCGHQESETGLFPGALAIVVPALTTVAGLFIAFAYQLKFARASVGSSSAAPPSAPGSTPHATTSAGRTLMLWAVRTASAEEAHEEAETRASSAGGPRTSSAVRGRRISQLRTREP